MSLTTSALTIGIDIGGTSLKAAVVTAEGQILDMHRVSTPHSSAALEDALERSVLELLAKYQVEAVGLAVAGFIDADRRVVRFAPHLPWRDTPVVHRMSNRLKLPVMMEHDANAAAWAELRFGAAVGGQTVVLVAIGTGIGAALLIDGQLYRGAYGVAPELGHVQVVPDGRRCSCGKSGCWERYCSGTSLAETVIELAASLPLSFTEQSVLARDLKLDPGSLTGKRVTAAAGEGDPLAKRAVNEFSRWLGLGLAMVGDIYDPDLIVIAGGVASSAPLFLDEARESYLRHVTGSQYRRQARIRRAELGEAAGMIGAADLARAAVH
ncbi:MAG: ROK family protein [Mycobacteriaceae bacterium]